jgi:hypothetical protein
MTDDAKPLLYHDNVGHLRRDLMAAHLAMLDRSQRYMNAVLSREKIGPREAFSDAWQAATAAYNTSYALAAVLGVAAKEFGDEVANRLAFVADDLLANGDVDPGHNADVTPEQPRKGAA